MTEFGKAKAEIVNEKTLADQWTRLSSYDLDYTDSRGETHRLKREIYHRTPAACILLCACCLLHPAACILPPAVCGSLCHNCLRGLFGRRAQHATSREPRLGWIHPVDGCSERAQVHQ